MTETTPAPHSTSDSVPPTVEPVAASPTAGTSPLEPAAAATAPSVAQSNEKPSSPREEEPSDPSTSDAPPPASKPTPPEPAASLTSAPPHLTPAAPISPPSASADEVAAPTAPTSSNPASASKPKSTRRKARRPRRRGASSGSDGEGEDDGERSDASSASLTSASSVHSGSESEDEGPTPAKPEGSKSTFADAAEHMPVGWDAAKSGEKVETVDFQTGTSSRGGAAVRGRGAAPAGAGKGKKAVEDMTEDERKRFDEKRARKKEKFKAKREELRAKKQAAKATVSAPPETSSSSPTALAPSASADAKATKPKPAKGKKADPAAALEASTSALSLDDTTAPAANTSTSPAPATGAGRTNGLPNRPGTNREAYADRLAKDPKFVPRVGGFWTHDQRHYESGTIGEGGYSGLRGLSDYWRGRGGRGGDRGIGGFDRGGFRGRGGFSRGGGVEQMGRGGYQGRPSWANVAKGQEILDSPKGQGRRLEMDRVFEEEQARERARKVAVVSPPIESPLPTDLPVSDLTSAPPQAADAEASAADVISPPPPPTAGPSRAPGSGKWGHEGFESVQAVEAMRGARGGFRGRGRGRGMFGPMRGGFFPNAFPLSPAQPSGTSPAHPTDVPAAVAPASAQTTKPASENTSTQPNAECLLGETSQTVTVNIPGSGIVPPSAPTPPVDTAPPAVDPAIVSSGPSAAPLGTAHPSVPAAAPSPIPPHVTGGSQPSPYTGSDSGSIPSSGHFVPPQPYLPPGIGVAPNGEYYNLANGVPVDFQPNPAAIHSTAGGYARPQFYPTHSQRNHGSYRAQAAAGYYQGAPAYSPDFVPSPGDSYGGQSPMYFPAAQNGYADRSGSPYPPHNPYAAQPSNLGYFVPPRSTKVSIRAPAAGGGGSRDAPVSPSTSKSTGGPSGGASFVPSSSTTARAAQAQGAVYYQAQPYNPYTANGYAQEASNGGYEMSQEAMQEWMAHQAAVAAANGWAGYEGAGYEGYGYQ